jgi:hypothetical protein
MSDKFLTQKHNIKYLPNRVATNLPAEHHDMKTNVVNKRAYR